MVYQFLLQTSVSVMIPQLMDAFSVDVVHIGWLSSSYFFFYILFQVPAGMLVDRFGARRLLSLGFLGCVVACFIMARAHQFWQAELSRIMMGFMTAPAFGAVFYLIAHWFEARYFALLVGLTEMLGVFGCTGGQLYIAHSLAQFNFKQVLWGCFLLGVFLALLTWLIVRDAPGGGVAQTNDSSPALMRTLWCDFCALMQIRGVWLSGLFAMFLCTVLEAFAALWCVPFLRTVYGLSLQKAAIGSAVVLFGIALGSPIFCWLFSGLFAVRRGWLMSVATLVCCIALLVLIRIPLTIHALFIILFIVGFSSSIYMLSFAITKSLVSPRVLASAMALINVFCMVLGAMTLQPLIGYLLKYHADVYGHGMHLQASDYRYALLILPICIAIGFGLIPAINRCVRRSI